MKNKIKDRRVGERNKGGSQKRVGYLYITLFLLSAAAITGGFFQYRKHLDTLSREGLARARVMFDGGNYPQAASVLQEVIRKNPFFEEGYMLLGKVYERDGETDRALELYLEFKRRWPEGANAELVGQKILNAKKLIKEDERAAKIFAMAENYKNNCQIKEALEWYQTIIENYPQSHSYEKALTEKWLFSASHIYHLWRKSTERLSKARDLLNSAEDFDFFSESVLKLLSLSENARNQAERYDLDMQREIQKFYSTHESLISVIENPRQFTFEPKALLISEDKTEGYEPEDISIARAYNEIILPALYLDGLAPGWPSLNMIAAYIFLRSEKYYANAAPLIMDIIEAEDIAEENPAKKKARELFGEL